MEGTIVRIISNLCTVDCGGALYDCKPRGKFYHTNISPLVGDHVVIDDVNCKKIMEVRRFLYNKQDHEQLI